MYVDGLGERPTVDTGGFPVIWIGSSGCTIGQDPDAGGTNCYWPGDVLLDAETGAQYQIGGDWHLYQLGNQPSSSPAPSGGGGYQQPNVVAGGGYGPYATAAPPVLTDLGTYVDNGRIIDHQVDQYGNDYYTDQGPAPSAPPPTPIYTPPPPVPSPRTSAPSLYPTAPTVPAVPTASTTTYTPTEPIAADGQRLSGQSASTQAAYRALYGSNAAATWVAQHNAAIGAGSAATPHTAPSVASATTTTRPAAIAGPLATAGAAAPGGGTAAITATGNPTMFGHQVVSWLTRSSFISGIPNGLLVVGGYIGATMLRRRRMF